MRGPLCPAPRHCLHGGEWELRNGCLRRSARLCGGSAWAHALGSPRTRPLYGVHMGPIGLWAEAGPYWARLPPLVDHRKRWGHMPSAGVFCTWSRCVLRLRHALSCLRLPFMLPLGLLPPSMRHTSTASALRRM